MSEMTEQELLDLKRDLGQLLFEMREIKERVSNAIAVLNRPSGLVDNLRPSRKHVLQDFLPKRRLVAGAGRVSFDEFFEPIDESRSELGDLAKSLDSVIVRLNRAENKVERELRNRHEGRTFEV